MNKSEYKAFVEFLCGKKNRDPFPTIGIKFTKIEFDKLTHRQLELIELCHIYYLTQDTPAAKNANAELLGIYALAREEFGDAIVQLKPMWP